MLTAHLKAREASAQGLFRAVRVSNVLKGFGSLLGRDVHLEEDVSVGVESWQLSEYTFLHFLGILYSPYRTESVHFFWGGLGTQQLRNIELRVYTFLGDLGTQQLRNT